MKSTKSTILNKGKTSKTLNYGLIMFIILGVILGILLLLHYLQKKKNTFINLGFLNSIMNTQPITGYYNWTWSGNGSGNPTGDWNIGILFDGDSPVNAINNLIKNSYKISAPIKYLNLGGGDIANGWSFNALTFVNNNLQNIKNNNWNGICFDVEACPPNVSFISAFQQCFANCKKIGLDVFITISGTVPWACKTGSGQGDELVNAWINDSNIDYISPQLYGADGTTLITSDLTKFGKAKAKIIPSIPYAKNWNSIQNLGITPYGYIVWNHDNKNPSTPNNICGSTWSDAANNCKSGNPKFCSTDGDCGGQNCYKFPCYSDKKCGVNYNDAVTNCIKNSDCPSGTDADCPDGQHCFAVPKTCS